MSITNILSFYFIEVNNYFPMNTNEVLLGKRTETAAEYCSSSNEGFLLALAVPVVEIAYVC